MLDFKHNPQVFPDAFAAIIVPDTIIPQVESRAYWDNQTVEVRFRTPHDCQIDWGKYRLRWELNKAIGLEGIYVVKISAADAPVGFARVPMPRVQNAALIPLSLQLIDATGSEVANRCDHLLVLPSHAAQARFGGDIAVMTLTGREAAIMRQLDYSVEESLTADTQVVVTNSPDSEVLRWVADGGKLLYVSESDAPVFWQHGYGGTPEGNWLTSTSWLSPGVYPKFKIDNPLNLPFQGVMPRGSIGGLPQEDPSVQRDFLAGSISGWVQRPSIHTVQFGYGHGIVIMTTYTLLESLRVGDPDPVGVVMFNDLIDYLVSDSCKPILRVKV